MDNQRRPKTPVGPDQALKFPEQSISFDYDAFDNLIESQGVRIRHMKAIPDPRFLQNRGEIRRSQPVSNTDQYIYKPAGCFVGTFYANDKLEDFQVEGYIDQSQSILTPPRTYENSDEPIIINIGDRFEIEDIELRVEVSQLVEASGIGVDRLAFPAVCVQYLIGSDAFEYQEGVHYKLNKYGEIQWITQKRPGTDVNTGKGEIYSIRYRYVPYFVARRLIHEIRIAQRTDPMTGQRFSERLPYRVQCGREQIFRDKRAISDADHVDPRFQDIPSSGGLYGPLGAQGGTPGGSEEP